MVKEIIYPLGAKIDVRAVKVRFNGGVTGLERRMVWGRGLHGQVCALHGQCTNLHTDIPQFKILKQVGDETMSVLEIWGAEYQENDCLLIKPEDRELLEAICGRERCWMQVCVLMCRACVWVLCVGGCVFIAVRVAGGHLRAPPELCSDAYTINTC